MYVIKYVGNFRMEICSKSAFSAKRARFHKLATFPQQGNSMRISSSSSSKVKTNSKELGDILPLKNLHFMIIWATGGQKGPAKRDWPKGIKPKGTKNLTKRDQPKRNHAKRDQSQKGPIHLIKIIVIPIIKMLIIKMLIIKMLIIKMPIIGNL